MAITEVG